MTMPLPVKRNAVHCYDCDDMYVDGSLVECPEDPSHAVEAAYVSDTPLGVNALHETEDVEIPDADYWHFGRKRYEYDGDEIVQPIEYRR